MVEGNTERTYSETQTQFKTKQNMSKNIKDIITDDANY